MERPTKSILTILIIFSSFSPHLCRKHKLKLPDDTRSNFVVSMFGFLKGGVLSINMTRFTYSLPPPAKLSNDTFGFTLVLSSSSGAANYMEDYRDTCILKSNSNIMEDKGDKSHISVVFFRMNFKNNTIMIERQGYAVKDLIIRGQQHDLNRRATDMVPVPDSRLSDKSLFQKTNNKVSRNRRESKDSGNPAPSETIELKTQIKEQTTPKPKDNATDAEGTKTENAPVINKLREPLITQLPLNKSNKTSDYSAYFEVYVSEDTQEGMYILSFHNCHNVIGKQDSAVNITVDVIEVNKDNYLSAGEIPIPALFFTLCVVYFIVGFVWMYILRTSDECVYKMHYLMFAVVLVKSLACLLHAMNSHFIQLKGIHEEAWAVLYYIAYLMRGALLFITVILIGSGWAFIKHVLSDKEKKLFLIVIPLQILDNIAWIIMEESEEGQSEHTKWKEIFILVDLLCCGAILFPVVWSIRHLTEAAQADGKAAISLNKLKLFRQFYIMVVCYIYFTRIIVYLLWMTVPFRYEWLNDMFKEIGTLVFFIVTGYKFRPASDNPYLQVPVDSDEEDIEMDEVLTKNGAYENVHRVNQGFKEDSPNSTSSTVKVRESSHEYD